MQPVEEEDRAGRVIRLTINDVYALKNRSTRIQYVSPELMRGTVSVKSAYFQPLAFTLLWEKRQESKNEGSKGVRS